MLLDHLATRPNQTTATDPASTPLFPGRRAGQPIHPGSLRLRLHRLGIPNLDGRTRAIRDLLVQAPPAVVASSPPSAAPVPDPATITTTNRGFACNTVKLL